MYRITLHSYMHYHHIAFLRASPSYGILLCITVMLHSYMHYHYITFVFFNALPCISFSPEKLISSLLSRNIKLSTRSTFRIPRMSQRPIDELQHGQELLKAEVKHLKSQTSLVMDLLQVVLKRECNTTPISANLVTALSSDVSMGQGHPHVENSPVQNAPTKRHHRPSP